MSDPVKTNTNEGAKAPVNGLGIAAMVVGIVAFLSGLVPFWGFIAGTVAVVLAIIGLKKPTGKGFAIAGLVTGAIGALSSLIFTVLFFMALAFGGTAINTINEAANEYTAENQSKLDAKKNFAKGETAVFDEYEVKVNSVSAFTPDNSYSTPADGKKFIAVTMTIKNISDEPQSISPYMFKVVDNGVAQSAYYLEADDPIESGDLSADASTTGTVVYEVGSSSTDLKLQYTSYAYDVSSYESKTLEYTLAF